jgi:hypothetical protein
MMPRQLMVTDCSTKWVQLLLLLTIFFISFTTAVAQQALITVSDRLPAPSTTKQSSSQQEEEKFIKPSRPSVANPAEIQRPGVLQVEYGYDANFRGSEFRTQQALPLTLRFAASSRLLIEFDLDTLKSETDQNGGRETGVGDTRLGLQVVALKDTESHPALAFAYYVKLPSGSEEKGLSTGRIDHKVLLLLSRKLGQTDMDLNVAYLSVGREDSDRRASGGQGAISFAYEFKNNFGVEGELSGQSLDDVQPRGLFALGALTYTVNKRFRLDGGMRFGLNPEAPRIGVFGGIVIGTANLYGK